MIFILCIPVWWILYFNLRIKILELYKRERFFLRNIYCNVQLIIYVFHLFLTVYSYTILITFLSIPLIPIVLNVMIPLNESRPLIYVYEAEYGIDKDKYYYPILLHNYAACTVNIMIVTSVDTMYIVCVLHACSLFEIVG